MEFSDRAVAACAKAMDAGTVTARHVRDVLRSKVVDVTPVVRFLESEDSMVRKMAATIVGEKKGPSKPLLDAVLKEEEKSVLVEMLTQLGKHGDAVEALTNIINSDDETVRDVAIDMFRRAGRADCLFPMLFDRDDKVVQRIKRYIHEQERQDGEVLGT
jgi:HEAT repeat protein